MSSKSQKNSLTKSSAIIGFLLLTLIVTVLIFNAVKQSFNIHPAAGAVVLIIAVGTYFTIFDEGKTVLKAEIAPVSSSIKLYEFIAVFVGSILSFYLNNNLGLGLVIGSALVGLLAVLVAPKYAVPVYCGSFAGMSSAALFPEFTGIILVSVIAGLVYVICRDVFGGFGGKLGAMGFMSAIAAGLILGRTFASPAIPSLNTDLWLILFAFFAAPLTFYLNAYLNNGPVLASSAIGLLGGIVLPALFPEIGGQLAVVVICASFAGMTSKARCPKFWYMLIAGLFSGFLFVLSVPLLGGCGGKLGTIGFTSIMSVLGFVKIIQRLRK